jgi:hypothetical protein
VFGIGAVFGVLLLGAGVWRAERWTATLSLAVGAVGLVTFLLFVLGSAPSLGLGVGLVERLAGYPVVAWMIVIGGFLLWSATVSGRRPAIA